MSAASGAAPGQPDWSRPAARNTLRSARTLMSRLMIARSRPDRRPATRGREACEPPRLWYKQQTKMKAKYLFFAILFFLGLGLDQGTKIWARGSLKPRGYDRAVVVVPGYFDLRYSENTG